MPSIDAAGLAVSCSEHGATAAGTPVFLIHGWPDDASTWNAVASVPTKFAGPFEMVGLPGVGHFPQREAPAAVADLLVAFLAGERP